MTGDSLKDLRFRQLALDLIRRCARIECRYNAGPNGDAGVLHARHMEDRLNTCKQKSQSQG